MAIDIDLKDVLTGLNEHVTPNAARDFTFVYDAINDELKKARLMTLNQVPISGNMTVRAGFGVYVPMQYELPDGAILEIAAGAVMEIG